MEIDLQVCDFEQAKQLFELGLKLNSWCVWYDNLIAMQWFLTCNKGDLGTNIPRIPAYTVAELGVLLGAVVCDKKGFTIFSIYKDFDTYSNNGIITVWLFRELEFKTEAQARAAALIWLLD